MSLLDRLKTETRSHHQHTESLLYTQQLMAGTLTRSELTHLLTIHYRFHSALETAVAALAGFFAGYNYDLRQKTPWLLADLQQWAIPLPTAHTSLFDGWNGYELLGALYVGEGSMLGGQVIAKALRRTTNLGDAPAALHFFGGYGDQTGLLWKEFGTYLLSQAHGQEETIIDAAQRAFDCFGKLALEPYSMTRYL